MKKKRSRNGIKGLIVGLVLVILVGGYYYYLSSKKTSKAEESTEVSAVQEALLRNLDNNYPPSPREVVKYFGQLTQCFYGEEYSEAEQKELAMQIQRLYDDELIANKTQQQYLDDLQWDIDNMKEQEIVVSSYSPSSSTDVEYYSQDGHAWAQLHCTFTLRKGTEVAITDQVFLLRKDDQGHWKIYGWQPAMDEQ